MEVKSKTSIYDIAKELGISASTVSRALANHKSISQARKEEIRAKAKEMNYRPNLVAVNLKSGKTNTIGVVVPYINRNFFSAVIEGIEEEAYRRNYDVIICQHRDDKKREAKLLRSLFQGKVDGIIASVAIPDNDVKAYKHTQELNLPVVFFDRASLDSSLAGSVRIDDYKGGYIATKHLIEQGCRRIFHFSGPLEVSIWKNRYRGWRDALRDSGITPQDNWLYSAMTTIENGNDFAQRIIQSADIPDAIFCAGDYAALGVIQTLKEHSCKVPDDVAVVGFANEPLTEFVSPSVSSVCQSSVKMGALSAKTLLDNLENGVAMENIVILPELIIRESSIKNK